MNWDLNGIQATDIQSVVLYEASKEGLSKCDEITDPNCGGNGWDYSLCQKSPEAHFVWFAITNWANYFNKLYNAFSSSTISLSGLTSTLVTQFYTPQTPPTNLILPVSIISGLAAGISAAWPPAALVAGAGGIINGALTQAGLNAPKFATTSAPILAVTLTLYAVLLYNGVMYKLLSPAPIRKSRRRWRHIISIHYTNSRVVPMVEQRTMRIRQNYPLSLLRVPSHRFHKLVNFHRAFTEGWRLPLSMPCGAKTGSSLSR